MLKTFGVTALLTILSHLVFIMMVWRTLNALRFEKFFKPGHTRELQMFVLFVSIAVGYLVSSAFLSLIDAFKNLPYLY